MTSTLVGNPESETGGALYAAIGHQGDAAYSPLDSLRKPLDIWDAFMHQGTQNGEWDQNSYAAWAAGIHALIDGKAPRTVIGVSGGENIYAYTAGKSDGLHALIIGGTHPYELTSQHAAMRFFTEFVLSDDPVMRGLRSRLKLTWIPTLTPAGFRSTRENANGVDINRNFPFFWEYYKSAIKGSAPFSETESNALKGLLDSTKIACVIDCHMLGNTGDFVMHAPATSWTAGNRRVGFTAASQWDQLYNTGNVTFGQLTKGETGDPNIKNWASKYMRVTKRRLNAFATTLEARVDIGGSQSGLSTTREAMRLYCGFIHMHLVEWLTPGQQMDPVQPRKVYLMRTVETPTVALADGGSKIETATSTPVSFNANMAGTGQPAKWADFPVPSAGHVWLNANVSLELPMAATEYSRVQIAFGWGISPLAGGDAPIIQSDHYRYVDMQPGRTNETGRAELSASYRVNVSEAQAAVASPLYRFQVFLRLMDASKFHVVVKSVVASVEFIPNNDTNPLPAANRAI